MWFTLSTSLWIYGIYVYTLKKRIKSAKLGPQSLRCQIVKYNGSDIYKVWDETKVIRTKNVKFDKEQVLKREPTNLLSHCNNILITKLL